MLGQDLPTPVPRPRNFVFSLGDKIRLPSPNFVTPYSYIGYNDDVQQRKLKKFWVDFLKFSNLISSQKVS